MATEKDGFGSNKSARLEAKRAVQDEEEQKEALPLDPEFPYEVARFDPFFFGVKPSLGD